MRVAAVATISFLALLLSLSATTPIQADPLDRGQVAAEAKWVIHVDMDAARSSTALKKRYQEKMKGERAKEHLEKVVKMTGMNPLKDIKSLTAYDSQFKRHSGVAIVEANNIKRDKLHSLFKKKHPDHKTTKAGKHTIYSWTAHKGGKHKREASGAFYGDSTIIMGTNVDQVKGAIAVLDGKAKSLGKDSPLAVATPKGTVLWLAAAGIAGSETPFHSQLIRKSERLSGALGENDGKLFYRGMLMTDSAEAANNVKAIIDGFRALISLNHGADTSTGKVLSGLKVSTEKKTVNIEWSADVEVAVAAAKEARKAHGKKHHHWHRYHGDKKKKEKVEEKKKKK